MNGCMSLGVFFEAHSFSRASLWKGAEQGATKLTTTDRNQRQMVLFFPRNELSLEKPTLFISPLK